MNRWRWLVTLIGIGITLSAISGQLPSYLKFLTFLYEAPDSILALVFPPSLLLATVTKITSILVLVWGLFYLALRQYAKTYQGGLESWIEQVRLFLLVPIDNRKREERRIKIGLFLLVPIKSLWVAVHLMWPGKKIIVVEHLQIHLWDFLIEVLFMHAVFFGAVMGVHLLLKTLGFEF